MSNRIAGVDVHKKMLAVVVSDVEVDGQYQFERRIFGSNPEQLRSLARHAGTVVRRAQRVHGPQAGVPTSAEDGIGAVAIPRAADRPTGPGDGQFAQPASRCRHATSGGPGSGSGFSATDHC